MRRRFGKVEDRSVAAEGDDQIRPAQLLLQRFDRQPEALDLFLVAERQAHYIRAARFVKHALGFPGDTKLRIAVGIGA